MSGIPAPAGSYDEPVRRDWLAGGMPSWDADMLITAAAQTGRCLVLLAGGDGRLLLHGVPPDGLRSAIEPGVLALLARDVEHLWADLGSVRVVDSNQDLRVVAGLLGDSRSVVVELRENGATLGTVWLLDADVDPAALAAWAQTHRPGLVRALSARDEADFDANLETWWQLLHAGAAGPSIPDESGRCVVVAISAEAAPPSRVLAACRAHFADALGFAAMPDYGTVYVVLAATCDADAIRRAGRLLTSAMGGDIRLSVGPAAASTAQLPWSRTCADDALELAWTRPTTTSPCFFDDELVDLVMLEVSRAVRQTRLPGNNPVRRLLEHDRRKGSDLATSLRVLLDCNCEARTAAERLQVHPNTLRYRVLQATKLLDLDLSDVRHRTVVHLLLLTSQGSLHA